VFRRLVLDYGHGVSTPGKRYSFDGGPEVREYVINRQIAARIMAKLVPAYEVWDALAGRVRIAPPFDLVPDDVSLASRVATANRLPVADTLFLSIHCDAAGMADHGPGEDARGASVWTAPGQTRSDWVAQSVCDALAAAGLRVRKDRSDGDDDCESPFFVLRETRCPAVLVECGFFTNRVDHAILSSECGQELIANAICAGVRVHLQPRAAR